MYNLKINHLFTLSLLSIGLTACGGGSSGKSGPTVHTGVFKDTVSGLSYVSGSQKGTTSSNSEFKYEEAENVTFNVGGVNLGTGVGTNIMTPADLVDTDESQLEAINIVRFLMMVDEDNDEDNGIEISKNLQTKFESLAANDQDVDFNVEAENFENEVGYLRGLTDSVYDDGRSFPTYEDAETYLNKTTTEIARNQRCSDAGGFAGTYSGSESGNIALILSPSEDTGVSGYSFNEAINYPVKVTSETNYDTSTSGFISNGALGNKYTGKLVSGNSLEGSWSNDSGASGTFSTTRLASNSGATYRYVAEFNGDDNTNHGILVLNETSNKISGEMYDATSGTITKVKEATIQNTTFDITLTSGENIGGKLINHSEIVGGYIIDQNGNTSSFKAVGCTLN